MKEIAKVNVLGTEYEILFNQDLGTECAGQFDGTTKQIKISKDMDYVGNYSVQQESSVRHELIHAFLFESGLAFDSDWATNEEIVDWIALQFPKLSKAFEELRVI